jgi:hypothetical protein
MDGGRGGGCGGCHPEAGFLFGRGLGRGGGGGGLR